MAKYSRKQKKPSFPNTEYRLLMTPVREGAITIVRAPYEDHPAFSYWTSWGQEWIDDPCAADPFCSMKDEYDLYVDITPAEAERMSTNYDRT